MPKGHNPNSRKALAENGKKTQFSGEYAARMAERSHEVRRNISKFSEAAREALSQDRREGLVNSLIEQAEAGNIKAFELMLKLIGEFPQEQVEVTLDSKSDCEETISLLEELKNAKKRSEDDCK